MLSIQKSHKHGGNCTLNALPCRVNYNTRAEVSKRYWAPTKTNGKAVSFFRGRQLHGRAIKVPREYKGLVLCSAETPTRSECHSHEAESQEVSIGGGFMEEIADFEELVVWGHEVLPEEATDPYIRGIEEYIAFANVVHIVESKAEKQD